MKMKLKDHKKIGKVVVSVRDVLSEYCCDVADDVISSESEEIRNSLTIKFKATMLILGAIQNLCNEYDFDCVTAGDDDE